MIHFNSLAEQLVRDMKDEYDETDALVLAVEDEPAS